MTFEEFVLESTGRNMDYHKNAGTVGMEFAQQAFDAGASQAPMKPCDGLTPDALRKWGEALNEETPRGLGDALIQFADAWAIEQQELAAAFTAVWITADRGGWVSTAVEHFDALVELYNGEASSAELERF